MHTLQPGTLSHGTLRSEDLLPVLMDTLRAVGDPPMDVTTAALLREGQQYEALLAAGHELPEDVPDFLRDLQTLLDGYAPAYCYVGMHGGDGAALGVWPDYDAMEAAVHDGDLLKVEDLSEVPDDYDGGVWLVNDHGNTTLGFQRDGHFTEEWVIV